MMKNKYYIYSLLSLFIALGFSSCSDDEYDFKKPNNLSDVSWYLSSEAENRNPIVVSLNKHLSLIDVSQGELSHVWEISDKGTFLLKGNMNYGTVDYTKFIDPTASHINNDKTINVLFTEPGTHTIRLINTFSKPVYYTYSNGTYDQVTGGTSYEQIKTWAKKVGDVYVMDTTFVIRVYDNVMRPAAKVYRDPEMTDEVETGIDENGNNRVVNLGYGDKLYFKDASTDSPNSWKWNCVGTGANVEGDSIIEMSFKKLSTIEKPLNVSLTVERISDNATSFTKFIPSAPSKTSVLPLDIVVGASKDPLCITSVSQTDQRTIKLTVGNGAFDPTTVENNTNALSALSVDIVNDKGIHADNKYVGKVGVSSLSLESTEGGENDILVLHLNDDIYNTDELKLNYNNTGNQIKTIDGRSLSFATQDVSTTYAFYINDDFESSSTYSNWFMAADGGDVPCEYQFIDNPTKDDVNSSEKCLWVNPLTNTKADCIRTIPMFTGGTSTYTFRFKYMILDNPKSGFSTCFIKPNSPLNDASWSAAIWYNMQRVTNKWITVEQKITGKNIQEQLSLSLRFNAFDGHACFDDFYFGNEELRP